MIVLLLLMTNLLSINTPPATDTVQKCFDENREDIFLLVSFMNKLGFNDIYISNTSGQVIADYSTLEFTNNEVCNAICRLLENKKYIRISKMGQTISFLQWTGLRDVGCGIIYSEDIEESIDREFLTDLVPLSDEGWFYYISDYSAWRNGERASLE